jgi:hypothetical protein
MNFESVRSFNQDEKIALLKLLIKVSGSDGKITSNEKKTLKEYLSYNNLKISNDFVKKSLNEDMEMIVSNFGNKINLNRAFTITSEFAKLHGINPEHEAIILNQIRSVSEAKKKEIKFSITDLLKTFVFEFAFLWGKEDLNPTYRKVLAIVFTLIACVLGAYWTHGFFWKSSEFVMPKAPAVISGLLIFGALCFRGYLPKPNNVRNIIFTVCNLFLFSIISMHIIGRSSIEVAITSYAFFGLLLLLWLGMKEILGFVFIGFFIILVNKLFLIDKHLDWRAFPFILSAFMGISFQSANFFDNFNEITSAFFKKPEVDKELIKESIEIAGQQTVKAVKKGAELAVVAAKASQGAG